LSKWFVFCEQKERKRAEKEISNLVSTRKRDDCNFIEWKDKKIIYRRYASLFFILSVDKTDNELLCLEIIHLFCISLDSYFGNVCELDLIFNFDKAYHVLDELFISGEIQETNVRTLITSLSEQDQHVLVELLDETLLNM